MQVRETPPFAPVLMESTRAIGYSLEAAIADIIDNSIAAKAGKVQLSFFPVGEAYLSGEAGIKRLEISFNGVKIKAADPFLLKKSTQAMDTETLIIRGKRILVKPYILPHISKMTEEEKKQLGGKEGIRKQQGFYDDLFRIWMAEEAIDWYGYITRAANELKDEIAKMKLANQTPLEFGLKVRQDPNSLIATARNKMRSATQVSRPVTVSGKLLETPRLKANLEILKSNEAAFKEFVEHLADVGTRDLSEKPYYWRGVPKELIVQLLLSFETHPWHLAFQGRALAEYVDEKMGDETWDAALITDGEGTEYAPGLKCGSEMLPIKATERRTVIADDKMIRISGTKVKVGSGGCTKVGLTEDQIELAKKRFREQNGDKHMSDSAYLIRERSPLLMLHVVETRLDEKESTNKDVPAYLFALGVGFPDTGIGVRTANYMVNMVELKNWMDPDEEDDE